MRSHIIWIVFFWPPLLRLSITAADYRQCGKFKMKTTVLRSEVQHFLSDNRQFKLFQGPRRLRGGQADSTLLDTYYNERIEDIISNEAMLDISRQGSMAWWQDLNCTTLDTLLHHIPNATNAVYSPNSDLISFHSKDDYVLLWKIGNKTCVVALHELQFPNAQDASFAFSAKGETFAASHQGRFRQWNVSTGELISETLIPEGPAAVSTLFISSPPPTTDCENPRARHQRRQTSRSGLMVAARRP